MLNVKRTERLVACLAPTRLSLKYVLFDNVTYIEETNGHGLFEGEFEEPMGSGSFWIELTNTWATPANFQMCNGWSDVAFNGFLVSSCGDRCFLQLYYRAATDRFHGSYYETTK